MKVEIAVEKTLRVTREYDVTEDQLNQLRNGENPFFDEMAQEIEEGKGYMAYDYAVNDLEGREIVPWS